MSVDFRTFNSVVGYITDALKPVLLRGRHGIGKSTVVYQYAKKINLPVVERRASQMTEGDLVGLPVIEANSTRFNPPDWFKCACDYPVVLFLDEVDRATIEVRQGIFELTDSRKLNGHQLHPETLIFAAVNGGEHGSQYQVGEMDPAELDRWTVFDIEPSVEDWMLWAGDNGISKEIIEFISTNDKHLEHESDFEPNKVYPSRRSWERLSECLFNTNLLDECNSELRQVTAAFVGFEAAIEFFDFVKNYDRSIKPEDIIEHGKFHLTLEFTANEHLALLQKISASKVFDTEINEQQAQNFAEYFMTLDPEIAMKAWTVLGSGTLDNTIMMHDVETESGVSVSARMLELLGDEDN
ncbi:MAG: AAA domain-containing protein [Candidatus Peribacter sp.]|jgi:hypothetical protein|nr:AAA domain-containing protein [Candidatus Peribacter sp.]